MVKGAAGLGLILVIVLLSVGTLFGFMLLPELLGRSELIIPQGHQYIMENMEIIVGETEQVALEPYCVKCSLMEWGAYRPLTLFETGNQYYQSTWIWSRPGGDTDAALTIWGPGNDGLTYEIEASRFIGYVPITILYQGEVIRSMPKVEWSTGSLSGYVVFRVVLPEE